MRRFLTPSLALAAVVVSMAACGSSDDNASGPTSTVTVTQSVVSSSSAAPSAPAAHTDAADQPAPVVPETDVADDTPATADVCSHATEGELLATLRRTAEDRRVAYPPSLNRIRCAEPFAIASTVGTVQSSSILFRYEDGGWAVLTVGSAIPYDRYGLTEAQKNLFIVGR